MRFFGQLLRRRESKESPPGIARNSTKTAPESDGTDEEYKLLNWLEKTESVTSAGHTRRRIMARPAQNSPPANRSTDSQAMRLVSSGILSDFVRQRNGEWNHEDWLGLLRRVRAASFTILTDNEVGCLLEEEKAKYWLTQRPVIANDMQGSASASQRSGVTLREQVKNILERVFNQGKPIPDTEPPHKYATAMDIVAFGDVLLDKMGLTGVQKYEAAIEFARHMQTGGPFSVGEWVDTLVAVVKKHRRLPF